MFARISTIIAILFFAMLTAASVQVVPRTDPPDGCSVDDLYCCNDVVGDSDPMVGTIAGLLGIDLGLIEGTVGLNCSPIKTGPGSGSSCSSQTVCCTGNNFSGLIVIDCSPININL
ncbi:fungal hydrophobin [Agaricus bisporus var. burnettii]|uniref:Hydrophobin n=1 Tax=Agaricus bisporus var. burnettii TaxID=192524 RepID=A0A8H7F074_AGABI|nr:fungal hydrophobin [Agaricus bisporus var. burnettii]